MPMTSGLDAQFGYAEESTYGTVVTPARFLPLVSENVNLGIARLESRGMLKGRRVLASQSWAAGAHDPKGSIVTELYDRSMGLLFKHMLGAVATTGAGPYTHTVTPGAIDGKSLTVQFGRPRQDGTVQQFTYAGCKISSWQIGCSVGAIPLLTLQVVGKDEDTSTALATASYPSGIAPLTFVGAAITLGGSSIDVTDLTMSGDNGIKDDTLRLGAATRREPKEANWRAYTASTTAYFDSMTAYTRFTAATEGALVALFQGAPNFSVQITMNVRTDGETPGIPGPDFIMQPLRFKAVGSTDATAITAVLTNSDSTP